MRIWLYQRMLIAGLAEGRIHQSTSLDAAPHTKPFIMYRQTSDIDIFRGDDGDACRQVGYMVFVHDTPGDYLRIDDTMKLLMGLFKDTIDQEAGVVRSRWLETSDDLRDDDMGTIMKFARIQVTYRVGGS
jgi:hypothetical protein